MMKSQKITSDRIWDLKYPCYVSPVPVNSQHIVHVPGEFEFSGLDNVISFTLECYKTKDKLYIFDAIPVHLWRKKICHISFEERLKFVRSIVTSQIADFKRILDLSAQLIDNPWELTDYCDNLLTQGISTVRIMDVDGDYVFGDCEKGELVEMDL